MVYNSAGLTLSWDGPEVIGSESEPYGVAVQLWKTDAPRLLRVRAGNRDSGTELAGEGVSSLHCFGGSLTRTPRRFGVTGTC